MDTFVTWVITLGNIGAVVLAIFAANYLRGKFPNEIETHWTSAIVPAVGIAFIHLSVYWIWPIFWLEWFQKGGFIAMQIVMVFGFYAASLASKPAKAIGKILVVLAFVGLFLSFRETYKILDPFKEVYIAPVASWSEKIKITPGTIIRPERPILIRTPDGRSHSDNADGLVKASLDATHVWVQSQDREPVNVTVSR